MLLSGYQNDPMGHLGETHLVKFKSPFKFSYAHIQMITSVHNDKLMKRCGLGIIIISMLHIFIDRVVLKRITSLSYQWEILLLNKTGQ